MFPRKNILLTVFNSSEDKENSMFLDKQIHDKTCIATHVI